MMMSGDIAKIFRAPGKSFPGPEFYSRTALPGVRLMCLDVFQSYRACACLLLDEGTMVQWSVHHVGLKSRCRIYLP
jgi:hypothetical protein